MKEKKRLDQRVLELYPDLSRTLIQSIIMQGKVSVDGEVITKPGTQVTDDLPIIVDVEKPKYVSRAGEKLEKALDHFNLDVSDLVVMDAGLSTGGFTDCLLQRGAAKVYGIDVGYGQVHEKIRNDSRVVVQERTNLRHLESLPELVDLATLDLSFISVLKVMDAVCQVLKKDGKLLVLIKPQFEVQKDEVGRGGIIKDQALHRAVIKSVTSGIEEKGFQLVGVTESPITGAQGNVEFLALFERIPA